ncbi:FecR domain-containing protein [Kerstersia similis]|uniref:FecR domain-containing protein n=1 Tax=Kerstersia similis TaxID=206505 RepID=UPI0039F05F13
MTDIPASVRMQAAQWLVDLQDPDSPPAVREAWQQWLNAHPDHALAWSKVEALACKTSALPAGIGRAALLPARPMRRQVLAVTLAGAAGAGIWQLSSNIGSSGRLQTATGERLEQYLADGSRLMLNTQTQVRVQFDGAQRLLALDRGELMVETAPDSFQPARPFHVRTSAGDMQAIGTRFIVRQQQDTLLHVLEGAVDVRRLGAPDMPVRVHASHQLQFSADRQGEIRRATETDAAWINGMLLVADMPLPDFIEELGRYRPGMLDCDPELAHLRVSGTFPLDDTDRVLAMLQQVLPVQVQRWTRYWVRVQPWSSSKTKVFGSA